MDLWHVSVEGGARVLAFLDGLDVTIWSVLCAALPLRQHSADVHRTSKEHCDIQSTIRNGGGTCVGLHGNIGQHG